MPESSAPPPERKPRVHNLLFHVKHRALTTRILLLNLRVRNESRGGGALWATRLAGRANRRVALLALALGLAGCGYEPVYGGERPSQRLSVVAAAHRTPNLRAVQGVLSGVREELAREGLLAPGEGYPRVVVEVLRVDEASAAVLADGAGDGARPRAGGSSVGVVARGWVLPKEGAQAIRDTGDVRRVRQLAAGRSPRTDARAFDELVSNVARETGSSIARRITGEAEPSLEPM
jgi:hypothetical protein